MLQRNKQLVATAEQINESVDADRAESPVC